MTNSIVLSYPERSGLSRIISFAGGSAPLTLTRLCHVHSLYLHPLFVKIMLVLGLCFAMGHLIASRSTCKFVQTVLAAVENEEIPGTEA